MNCARCLESDIETPATHHAKATQYYMGGRFIECENEGAYLCKPCLEYTASLGIVRLSINELEGATK